MNAAQQEDLLTRLQWLLQEYGSDAVLSALRDCAGACNDLFEGNDDFRAAAINLDAAARYVRIAEKKSRNDMAYRHAFGQGVALADAASFLSDHVEDDDCEEPSVPAEHEVMGIEGGLR